MAVSPYAVGGSVELVDIGGVNYYVHTLSSLTTAFEAFYPITFDALFVAGGGGGGRGGGYSQSGGGGGAGGVRQFQGLSASSGAYIVAVGRGGAGSSGGYGVSGDNTSAFGFEAAGGGGGAPRFRDSTNRDGLDGGSGSGGTRYGAGGAGNVPSVSPVQGYDGSAAGNSSGGAGGGAGGSPPGANIREGGPGRLVDWFGASVYYGGGGATGESESGTSYSGGVGGGGASHADGVDGLGGGGGGGDDSVSKGGDGGDGVIILRYPEDLLSLGGVSGVITDADGNPAARVVRFYTRAQGRFILEVVSDPTTGEYLGSGFLTAEEYQRVVLADETDLRNDIIDRVMPG